MRFPLAELAEAERSASAGARQLDIATPIPAEELLAIAQISMLSRESSEVADSRSLYTEEDARDLISSARILDALSAGDHHPDSKRAAHFNAAVCFAMQGNFPSASAVLSRANPDGLAPIEAVVASLCAPALRSQWADGIAFPAEYQQLLRTHSEFLAGASTEKDFRASFVEFAPQMLRHEDPFFQSLLDGLKLAVRQNIRLSTHRCLTKYCPELSVRYISNLINSGVPTLLPTQYMAAKTGLLSGSENSIISVPTSTGKTLIAELCAVNSLRDNGLACIITPYIALGRQVAASIRLHLRREGIKVNSLVGGVELEAPLDPGNRRELVIATPERLDAMLRSQPGLIGQLKSIVIDEAHLIENGGRGVRLEGLISRLRLRQQARDSFRLVLISAVFPQNNSLEDWLGAGTARFTYSWRPTARRLAIWKLGGQLQYFVGDDPVRLPDEPADAPIGSRTVQWEVRPNSRTPHAGVEKIERRKLNQSVSAFIAGLIKPGEPVLCVCSTKANSRTLARAIAGRLPERDLGEHLKLAVEMIDNKYPFFKPLRSMLERGIAYHNSAVPPDLRVLIEEAVKHKELFAVAATTTLAEGVDLPFRYTVIVDWLTYSNQGRAPIKGQLLKNIAGRCGRAGVYTEGDTIIVENPIGEAEFTSPAVRGRILSNVIFKPTDRLGSALGEAVLEERVDGTAELSSQLLAAIAENPEELELAQAFAGNTFARFDSERPVRRFLQSAIDDVLSSRDGFALATRNSPLKLTPLGIAVNRSGFSPASSRALMTYLNGAQRFRNLPELSASLLQHFGGLPEQPSAAIREAINNPRSQFPIKPTSYAQVTYDWLTGVPPHESFARLPNLLRSRRDVSVTDWSVGATESLDWEAIFDRYMEFLASQFEEYIPRLTIGCQLFSEHLGGWASGIDWNACRKALAQRRDYWTS